MKVYCCYPKGKTKALTFSYDDGKIQDRRLVEMFNKYNLKGTFNINYGLLNRPERVPENEVSHLYVGHEIATHTLTHPTICRCPMTMVAEEILADRKGLESITNYVVRGHAYPNGSYNKDIMQLFQQLGIAYGRVVPSKADFELPENPMEWYPTCHHNDPKLMELGKEFVELSKRQYLKLMYVWGHSYEFDNNNNWEMMEEFCQLISGKDDIWYATNIEIIDYMEVLKNLKFTADGEGVFNPSASSAWVQIDDDRIVEVKGGMFTRVQTSRS